MSGAETSSAEDDAAAVRIGLAGGGNWGRNLARTLYRMGSLAAVADPAEQVRRAVADEMAGTSVFNGFSEMLDDAERLGLHAVAIASPAPMHFEMAKAALEAGLDAFVEKPMTLGVADSEDLTRIADERGRILMAGHLLLYQPAVRWIEQAIHAGEIGRVFSIHIDRLKLGRARSVENVMWSFGVHDVAVLLRLAGAAPARISVTGHCGLQPGIEDDIYLHLRMGDGAMLNLHNSWLWPQVTRQMTVVGSSGMLHYDELARKVIRHQKAIDPNDLHNRDEGSDIVFHADDDPLRLELEEFMDCVRTRRAPLSDGRSAVEVIRVLARAEEMLEGERSA